ncbi:MAG: hypothetical protein WCW66_04470 [Patescibacteria group bacterium]|jgi:hypothetical protein
MDSNLRAVIIKRTAQQLGVSEDDVAMDTVIPNIHALVTTVAAETGEIGFCNDIRKKHTVAEAIALFEE